MRGNRGIRITLHVLWIERLCGRRVAGDIREEDAELSPRLRLFAHR
jgi:hypothetical protein